jgi:hypothetical protein
MTAFGDTTFLAAGPASERIRSLDKAGYHGFTMPFVQIKLGDMFDGPSDLIVLPCSTSGTVTSFVRQRLMHHQIPYPNAGMELGDVSVMPFEGGENIAQYVAYAASVNRNSSTLSAISKIGKLLGQATHDRSSIRRVAAPLLGAGAGGLASEDVVGALSRGFKDAAHQDATLIIHVLHEPLFGRLGLGQNSLPPPPIDSNTPERPTRVFVSYSRTSPEHEKWVERLATYLRDNGVDARLDTWHLRRGMDLPQWMTNELTLAERVVLVSDTKYAEKADGRVGGVGWETMIVQGDISKLPPDSTKYLVIVRSPKVDEGLPMYLKTKFVIHWPDGSHDTPNQQTLLREIYNIESTPPIGRKPVFV